MSSRVSYGIAISTTISSSDCSRLRIRRQVNGERYRPWLGCSRLTHSGPFFQRYPPARSILGLVVSRQWEFAASESSSASTPSQPGSTPERVSEFLSAFWKFLRPHTIRGTIVGSMTVTARALIENPEAINWMLFPRALIGVLALLCGNGFIVGINQIYDIPIDEVNKPFLPVASKEISVYTAWTLVIGLAAAGITLASHYFGPLIGCLYSLGLFLGMIYSVPPFRLKRFAIPAFLIIATVRGFLLNFGVYYATRAALKLPFRWSPAISFITVFVTLFAVSIAITKDLPDIKGDRQFNIKTFATRMGVKRITFLGSGLLLSNYIGAGVLACLMPRSFNPYIMIGGHAILSGKLILETVHIDQQRYQHDAIQRYYTWIWILFYCEYLLLPFL